MRLRETILILKVITRQRGKVKTVCCYHHNHHLPFSISLYFLPHLLFLFGGVNQSRLHV